MPNSQVPAGAVVAARAAKAVVAVAVEAAAAGPSLAAPAKKNVDDFDDDIPF